MKRKQQLLGLLVITGLGIPSFANAQKKDSLKEKLYRTRNIEKVPITLPSGQKFELSVGQHNLLQKMIKV
mgnify:CR=1 FL=1